jgi:D-alanyl-D-alanine carboxypeptidase/D-alanyl-D-alanine-endopeptidase (penicillin-binding protein 4)
MEFQISGHPRKWVVKFQIIIACILFFASPVFSSQNSTETNSQQTIGKRIDHILKDRCLKDTKIGVKIVSLKTGEIAYEKNSNEFFIPASNIKLVTSAAALSRLKPDYRFKTIVSHDGTREEGIIQGNVYIKGYGDPKLVTEELLMIVRGIRSSGIELISGDIVADDSFFDNERIGNGWKIENNSRAYNAKIGALSLNFNTINGCVKPGENHKDKPAVITNPPTNFVEVINRAVTKRRGIGNAITIDRIEEGGGDKIIIQGEVSAGKKRMCCYRTISNPPLYTATVFKEFLEREGIHVKGGIRLGVQPPDTVELINHESVPLSIIVRDLNKMSNNFIAEQILKTLGAEVKGEQGTAEKGLEVVRDYLKEIGIPGNEYRIADGSGLSKLNNLTPSQIVRVLESMYDDFKLQAEYIASLSVMGVDGSLKERMEGSLLKGMVRGKTGTLDGVSAVSGYAACSSCSSKGEIYAFSIIMNGFQCDFSRIWHIQNQIISAIAGVKR